MAKIQAVLILLSLSAALFATTSVCRSLVSPSFATPTEGSPVGGVEKTIHRISRAQMLRLSPKRIIRIQTDVRPHNVYLVEGFSESFSRDLITIFALDIVLGREILKKLRNVTDVKKRKAILEKFRKQIKKEMEKAEKKADELEKKQRKARIGSVRHQRISREYNSVLRIVYLESWKLRLLDNWLKNPAEGNLPKKSVKPSN